MFVLCGFLLYYLDVTMGFSRIVPPRPDAALPRVVSVGPHCELQSLCCSSHWTAGAKSQHQETGRLELPSGKP